VSTRSVLRHRAFALLWAGGVVSHAGDWLLSLALPYHVYDRSGSTVAAGLLFMVFMLPRLLFGSVAGVFADRWERRRTMLGCDLFRAAVVLAMLPIGWDDASLWLAYPLTFLEATATTLFRPAKGALVPSLVPPDELLSANALDAVGDSVIRLVAPPLGGALLAAHGLGSVLAIDAATYLVSAAAIALLPRSPPPRRPGDASPSARWRAYWAEWVEGLRVVAGSRPLRDVFLVSGLGAVGAGLYGPLLPPFVEEVLGAGPEVLGWMVTATGVGTLAAGLLLGRAARLGSPARLAAGGQVILGLALLATFQARDPLLVVALSAPAGVGLAAGVGFGTALQAGADDATRGRVLGASGTTGALAILLGQALATLLAEPVGLLPMLDLSGALILAAGLLGMVRLRGYPMPR
jgi:MFS family permease